jgi:pectinesterase
MGSHIRPEGWHNWNKKYAEKTAFYAEYGSAGEGARQADRVKWSRQIKKKDLKRYTPENVLDPGTEIDKNGAAVQTRWFFADIIF